MWKTRLSELHFDGDEVAAAVDAIGSEWITTGPRTLAFEEAFARVAGTRHAVAVSNGTAALILALKGAGIGPGDEVLCPSLTFVATAAAVIHCGATPVFVDIIGPEDPTMDPEDAARRVTGRTRVLLPMHYAGLPCRMDELNALARSHDLKVIEDAAHAPGARYRNRPTGSLGTAGCFSLYANKNITAAEGGVVTTDDANMAETLRRLRCHGMTASGWDRDRGQSAHYDVVDIGYNFRFDDIRAAIGLAQLRKLDRINRRRRELARIYSQALELRFPEWVRPVPMADPDRAAVCHLFPVVLPTIAQRDALEHHLRDHGIQTSIHYRPVHTLTAFRRRFPGVRLPRTEQFGERTLTLPLYPSMSEETVSGIVGCMPGLPSSAAVRTSA